MLHQNKSPYIKPILKTFRSPSVYEKDVKHRFPKKGSKHSACHDLFAYEIDKSTPNLIIVRTGLRFQPPSNFKVIFVPRSSFTNFNWIMQNSPSQGDADFTGEYTIRFRAIPTGLNLKNAFINLFSKKKRPVLTYDEFPYKQGDRFAQMYLERVQKFKFEDIENLDEFTQTERGEGGYGSTGV